MIMILHVFLQTRHIEKISTGLNLSPFWAETIQSFPNRIWILNWHDVVQKGPKWSQMVNITCFWPFGTIWTHLHHFGPFKTKINFSPQKHKVLLGQSSLEQKIKFCLKWSKRVQMSPKMSQMVKNMLYWPFGTLLDHIVPVQNSNSVRKTLDNFSSKWRQIYSSSWNLLNVACLQEDIASWWVFKENLESFLLHPKNTWACYCWFQSNVLKIVKAFLATLSRESSLILPEARRNLCSHKIFHKNLRYYSL